MMKKEAHNPLFLKMACEELRVFGVFEKVQHPRHCSLGLYVIVSLSFLRKAWFSLSSYSVVHDGIWPFHLYYKQACAYKHMLIKCWIWVTRSCALLRTALFWVMTTAHSFFFISCPRICSDYTNLLSFDSGIKTVKQIKVNFYWCSWLIHVTGNVIVRSV